MQGDEQGSKKQRLQKAFHKFNNLLVTIMGSATLGKRETNDDSDPHRHFSNVEEASRQAAELVQEIRDLIGFDEREEFEALVVKAEEEPPPAPEEPVEEFVLVVDDDEMNREVLVRMLETMGRRVVAVESGLEAIRTVRAHPSSLRMALVDLTMPGMNGEQVYLEIRRILPDLRIVMMSGYGENASLTFLQGGASEFLQKPFTLAELREVVDS